MAAAPRRRQPLTLCIQYIFNEIINLSYDVAASWASRVGSHGCQGSLTRRAQFSDEVQAEALPGFALNGLGDIQQFGEARCAAIIIIPCAIAGITRDYGGLR